MKRTPNEIKIYLRLVREAGYRTSNSGNAGGWVKLAEACGFSPRNKSNAKRLLRIKFGQPSEVMAPAIQPRKPKENKVNQSKGFLRTYEWRVLRMKAIKKYGNHCQCCGASPADGIVINVDHIKPRKLHPELALDINNLQVLCSSCNHGKGNWDETDWRTPEENHMRELRLVKS